MWVEPTLVSNIGNHGSKLFWCLIANGNCSLRRLESVSLGELAHPLFSLLGKAGRIAVEIERAGGFEDAVQFQQAVGHHHQISRRSPARQPPRAPAAASVVAPEE